jgi:hypothetical protein
MARRLGHASPRAPFKCAATLTATRSAVAVVRARATA